MSRAAAPGSCSAGPRAKCKGALNTELHRYEINGTPHFANAADPSVPAALAPLILLIRDWTTFASSLPTWGVTPNPNFTTGGSPCSGAGRCRGRFMTINPVYQGGFNGTGQKIAVVGQTDIHLSDIEYFRAQYGLPANNPQLVLVAGSPDPGVSPDDLIESSLDLEYAGGIAPDATIVFVYSTDVLTSVAYAIDQDLAPVIQYELTALAKRKSPARLASTGSYLQSLAEQGNSLGRDVGWHPRAIRERRLATRGPAFMRPRRGWPLIFQPAYRRSPRWVAPSSTKAAAHIGAQANNAKGSSALSYIPEKAWNDTAAGGGAGGHRRRGQHAFPEAVLASRDGVVPNDGARDVPDLAFAAANDHDPYRIYANGEFLYIGGTVSTPGFLGYFGFAQSVLSFKRRAVATWTRQRQSHAVPLGPDRDGNVSRHHGGEQHGPMREWQPGLLERPVGL